MCHPKYSFLACAIIGLNDSMISSMLGVFVLILTNEGGDGATGCTDFAYLLQAPSTSPIYTVWMPAAKPSYHSLGVWLRKSLSV